MTVEQLARLTLRQAEDQYRDGRLTQVEYEAYMRGWADAGGTKCGYRSAQGWSTPSDDPAVEELAAMLVKTAKRLACQDFHTHPKDSKYPRVWR